MISHLSKITTVYPVPPIFFLSIWLRTAPTSMGVVRPEPSQEAAWVEAGLARHRNPTPMKDWLKKIDQTYARNLWESTATPATPHFKDPFHQGSLFQPLASPASTSRSHSSDCASLEAFSCMKNLEKSSLQLSLRSGSWPATDDWSCYLKGGLPKTAKVNHCCLSPSLESPTN